MGPRTAILAFAFGLAAAPAVGAECKPLETRSPNASSQKPSFQGQTRACAIDSKVAFRVEVVAKGLDKPWSVEPMPGGDVLVTEKGGRMRIVGANGQVGEPIAGVPEVDARG
ncbi:MAG TPA: PQQ-dependent sugar dehydrogenase, partial [Gemmatimonadaceae bacterium]|nr:PQQ-dependent sugar dehydrogenase [Gemmatimonadaceae bacterium]